jgi:DNA-binding response OmpR family regulator
MSDGRVLVVEDDCAVAGVICDMINAAGLDCHCVRSDREAYAFIATPPPIRALVVDVNLGAGTTGFDVARFARQTVPDVPVVYVTGEASPQSFKAFGVPGSALVVKPFTADELLAPLRERLGHDTEPEQPGPAA